MFDSTWLKPSPEQLTKINQHRPSNASPFEIDDVLTIDFVASNNLISRTGEAWTIKALRQMEELYNLSGAKFLFDHEWDDSEYTIGKVYSAQLIKTTISEERLRRYPEYLEYQKEIIDSDGYWELIVSVFIDSRKKDIAEGLYFGQYDGVSTGTIVNLSILCPRSMQPIESCNHKDCLNCLIDHPNLVFVCNTEEEVDEIEKRILPYYLREGIVDAIELSLVPVPNLPLAGMLRERDKDS